MAKLDAYIYGGVRTPFGRHGGVLAYTRTDDLLASAIKGAIEKVGFPADAVEDVIAGCVNQAGEDCRNVARFAGLLAGVPETAGALTVNRLCGSSLSATLDAARCVSVGDADLYVACGVEGMSRAPIVMKKPTEAFTRQAEAYDTTIQPRFMNPVFKKEWGYETMPETAENVAKEFGISRERSDAYAYNSQQRYAQAAARGFYDDEIMSMEVATANRKVQATVDKDEHPRPDTSLEKMGQLRPLFEGGVVTAANASGINDGAGAIFVGSRAAGEKHGIKPMARILSGAIAGVPPRTMGIGPGYAIPKALERAGLTLKDMDLIEINEAFACQVLGCNEILKLADDEERLNPNGGAIAIGHPLGASGVRLALTGARSLAERCGRYAVISACIGVGQGIAMVIEREDA